MIPLLQILKHAQVNIKDLYMTHISRKYKIMDWKDTQQIHDNGYL